MQTWTERMMMILSFILMQPLVTLTIILNYTVCILVPVVSLLFFSMIYTVFKHRKNPCVLSRSPKLILIEDTGKSHFEI